MAGKNSKEKIGFKDLVTFAKAGWTPEETNALLDRLDAMGDPNDPDMGDPNDPDSVPDEDDLDDLDDVDNVDDDSDNETDEVASPPDNTSEGSKKNLDKMKALAYDDMKVENERLKNEIKKLRAKNRRADLSGQDDKKTNKESLIDAFQSCF